MAENSGIEWTDSTWNPTTGCTKVSPGCAHCYAERFANRLQLMGQFRYRNGFKPTLHHDALEVPLKWGKPRFVFVNSMSDLFHEEIPFSFISRVFKIMGEAKKHTFQVLTKRSDRLAELSNKLSWSPNIWIGISVENSKFTWRIEHLRQIPAFVRFLSIEPLLGSLPNLSLDDIHWVIVGGESGPKARPNRPDWVRDIQRQCQKARVPFFFKQWGGVNKKINGRLLDGKTWDEYPAAFSSRYFETFSV